ncbi:hypothetical protein Tcan_02882 [Toxocara canis]|uniref:Uncharacterized protein n=1 Tax=Toxocara canis TaxID=6265 RepID=A0A0B2VBQ2_TOXCA|nr:hypothetical protein Tcan_02882 [Toxocara canis]
MRQILAIVVLSIAALQSDAYLLRFARACSCPPATCTCMPTDASTQVSCTCVPPEQCPCSAEEQQEQCMPVCQDVCQTQCTGENCGPMCQDICTGSCVSASLVAQPDDPTMATAASEDSLSTSSLSPVPNSEQGMNTPAFGDNVTQDQQQTLSPYPQAVDQTTTSPPGGPTFPPQYDQPQTSANSDSVSSSSNMPSGEQESENLTQQPTSQPPQNQTTAQSEREKSDQTTQQPASNETETAVEPLSPPLCTICIQFPYQQPYAPPRPQPQTQPYYGPAQTYTVPQYYIAPQPQPAVYLQQQPQTYMQPRQTCSGCMPTITFSICNPCAMGICC